MLSAWQTDCQHVQWKKLVWLSRHLFSRFRKIDELLMSIRDIRAKSSFRFLLIKFNCHHHQNRWKWEVFFRFRNHCLQGCWNRSIWICEVATLRVQVKVFFILFSDLIPVILWSAKVTPKQLVFPDHPIQVDLIELENSFWQPSHVLLYVEEVPLVIGPCFMPIVHSNAMGDFPSCSDHLDLASNRIHFSWHSQNNISSRRSSCLVLNCDFALPISQALVKR